MRAIDRSEERNAEPLQVHVSHLSALQQLHHVLNWHALLPLLPVMDAAREHGAIRDVMSGVNPRGREAFNLKHPNATELGHGFLWRCTNDLPGRERIAIVNLSYDAEKVLIIRLHPEWLSHEALPDPPGSDKTVWHQRFRFITILEPYLQANGCRIVNFFTYFSQSGQRKRLLAPIDEPDRNGQFSSDSIMKRAFWKRCLCTYGDCLSSTSTSESPRRVVAAVDKENARLSVSQLVLDTREGIKISSPKMTAERERESHAIPEKLVS